MATAKPLRPRRLTHLGRGQDGAVSLHACSAVNFCRPGIVCAERASRHHIFDETSNQPLTEKCVITLMAIARDTLPLAIILQEIAQLVGKLVEIAVKDEFFIRENLVIPGGPRNKDEQPIAGILREAI